MFYVDGETRKKRLDKCRACAHFVKETQSCGTLLIGKSVPYGKQTRQLCGCIMPLKTQFRHMSCPINKWRSTLKASDVKELRKVLKELEGSRVTKDQNVHLTQLYNRFAGTNKSVSNCAPCVKKMITKLKELIDE
jgi:hypothetical protein